MMPVPIPVAIPTGSHGTSKVADSSNPLVLLILKLMFVIFVTFTVVSLIWLGIILVKDACK